MELSRRKVPLYVSICLSFRTGLCCWSGVLVSIYIICMHTHTHTHVRLSMYTEVFYLKGENRWRSPVFELALGFDAGYLSIHSSCQSRKISSIRTSASKAAACPLSVSPSQISNSAIHLELFFSCLYFVHWRLGLFCRQSDPPCPWPGVTLELICCHALDKQESVVVKYCLYVEWRSYLTQFSTRTFSSLQARVLLSLNTFR